MMISLQQIKHSSFFRRCLAPLFLQDVKNALKRYMCVWIYFHRCVYVDSNGMCRFAFIKPRNMLTECENGVRVIHRIADCLRGLIHVPCSNGTKKYLIFLSDLKLSNISYSNSTCIISSPQWKVCVCWQNDNNHHRHRIDSTVSFHHKCVFTDSMCFRNVFHR